MLLDPNILVENFPKLEMQSQATIIVDFSLFMLGSSHLIILGNILALNSVASIHKDLFSL